MEQAILDRLVHNAYRIELRGPSMWTRTATLSTGTKRRMKTKISVKISPLLTLLTNRPHQQQGRIVER